jgi:hypothetical protein
MGLLPVHACHERLLIRLNANRAFINPNQPRPTRDTWLGAVTCAERAVHATSSLLLLLHSSNTTPLLRSSSCVCQLSVQQLRAASLVEQGEAHVLQQQQQTEAHARSSRSSAHMAGTTCKGGKSKTQHWQLPPGTYALCIHISLQAHKSVRRCMLVW